MIQPSPKFAPGFAGDQDSSPLKATLSTALIHPLNISSPRYPLPPEPDNQLVSPNDLDSPDGPVERDPRLIRLTGAHPFNAEPPLSKLYDGGFITGTDLHFVRNHGNVPRCEDRQVLDWTITVEGMVQNPFTITLADLINMPGQITCPVTLVCAGNRRKEQNMVRMSKGFSWGPAGLSTSLWTGLPISHLLARSRPQVGARYVCFQGADKLPNGYYGTSVKLNWCLDANRAVMVAHRMNGRPLRPDHGKPVRIIIPGQVGGRSVKWLKKIIVTAEPSDNWYHIYDNRLLPTTVSPKASVDLPEVWKDERYAVYELNSNSVICHPAHDETVSLEAGAAATYKLRGYAYGGGGRRISRMEVTLDKGRSWILAALKYPEDDYRKAPVGDMLYGGRLDMWWRETSFCWCFWELEVAISKLAKASDIMVRAMDEALMTQPRDMYWSVLGLMNNSWFRVVIHREGTCLRFEHPTQPASAPGGWMQRVKQGDENLNAGLLAEKVSLGSAETIEAEPKEEPAMINPSVNRVVTLTELAEHSHGSEPWFVVNGQVYDGTLFLERHPGGPDAILGAAGQESTDEFLAVHSEIAKAMMAGFHIGKLAEPIPAPLPGPLPLSRPERDLFLDAQAWNPAALQGIRNASEDTKVFRFKLENNCQSVGLPIGQHVLARLRHPITHEIIVRPYTPLPLGSCKGILELLVKIYRDSPQHPGGKMTQALDNITVGEVVEFKGPVGNFLYLGRGFCAVFGRRRIVRRFNMICVGSGITPIMQILQGLTSDCQDVTECVVVDGNRTEGDILCRVQLDAMVGSTKNRCRVSYTLTRPSPTWKGRKGRIDESIIESEVGTCESKGLDMVLICGPRAMEERVQGILLNLKWAREDLFFF